MLKQIFFGSPDWTRVETSVTHKLGSKLVFMVRMITVFGVCGNSFGRTLQEMNYICGFERYIWYLINTEWIKNKFIPSSIAIFQSVNKQMTVATFQTFDRWGIRYCWLMYFLQKPLKQHYYSWTNPPPKPNINSKIYKRCDTSWKYCHYCYFVVYQAMYTFIKM